jgi:hypothetical protein
MTATTPKTEPPPSTWFRKIVTGGSLWLLPKGVWRGNILLSLADVHLAAGRKDEAIATYKTLLADPTVEPRQRKTAEERLKRQ